MEARVVVAVFGAVVVALGVYALARFHRRRRSAAAAAAASGGGAAAGRGAASGRGRFVVSAFGTRGRREAMEDAHVAAVSGESAVAAVFDGCGGARASAACAALLDEARRDALAAAPDPRAALEAFLADAERKATAAAADGGWVDATTALVAVVGARGVAVSWVGDSRAVLCCATASSRRVVAWPRSAGVVARKRGGETLFLG